MNFLPLRDAYTGSISVSDFAWLLMKKLGPAHDVQALIGFLTNFIDNIRMAFGGSASVWQILKMIPDFAVVLAGFFPGAGAFVDLYSFATLA